MAGSRTNPVVLVFAKAASPGAAKTRLSPPLSPDDAARVHAWMVEATLRRILSWPFAARVLAVSPDTACARFAARWPQLDAVIGQGDGDLGERMRRVMEDVYRRDPRPLVLLGTDAPDLPTARFERAAAILQAGGCVMCPGRDGGYCLLGVPAPTESLFQGIDWGTSLVAQQTRRAAARAGLELAEIEPWEDVDTIADLDRLIGRLEQASDPPLRDLRRRLVSAKLRAGSRENSV